MAHLSPAKMIRCMNFGLGGAEIKKRQLSGSLSTAFAKAACFIPLLGSLIDYQKGLFTVSSIAMTASNNDCL